MSALSLHTYGIGRPMTAAEQQSTGALLLIGAACAIALAVAAVMVGLEWWAERRGRHRFVLLADDMPVVVPASVRVWTEDMEGGDSRDRRAVLVDAEAVGWLPVPDSVDTPTFTRLSQRISR
jgi:hypothetical protein